MAEHIKKRFICIRCPQGCALTAELDGSYLLKVEGNKCPKGLEYAQQEITNPRRTLTSTILTKNLNLKLIPVKTNQPIPKEKIPAAMEIIQNIQLNKPVKVGEVIIKNLLGTGVDLVACRSADKG